MARPYTRRAGSAVRDEARRSQDIESHASEIAADYGAFEENPFLQEDQQGLPYVPDEPDKDIAYCWIRHSLGGQSDAKNILANTTGKLRYEFVKAEDMPHLMPLKAEQAGMGGLIVYNDVALAKTSYRRREQYKDAIRQRTNQTVQTNRDKVMDERYRRDPRINMRVLRDSDTAFVGEKGDALDPIDQ